MKSESKAGLALFLANALIDVYYSYSGYAIPLWIVEATSFTSTFTVYWLIVSRARRFEQKILAFGMLCAAVLEFLLAWPLSGVSYSVYALQTSLAVEVILQFIGIIVSR